MPQFTIKVRRETYDRLKLTSLSRAFPDGKPSKEEGWLLVPVGSPTLKKLDEIGGPHDEALNTLIDRALDRALEGL